MEKIGQIISETGAKILKNIIETQENLFMPDLLKELKSLRETENFSLEEIFPKNIFEKLNIVDNTDIKASFNTTKGIKIV